MRQIYLIARREYLAYVSAWGFWVSLLTGPLLLAFMIFGPLAANQVEPPRAIAILANDPADFTRAKEAIENGRRMADLPPGAPRTAGLGPRYVVVTPPAATIDALKPYLIGEQKLTVDGRETGLFGALVIKRENGAVSIAYWSTTLTELTPARAARRALGEEMRLSALAERGLSAEDAKRIDDLMPAFAQFDPRPDAAGKEVEDSDRAPFIVASFAAIMLWMSVFSVANMLLTSVIEEKSNKILDSLLTSAAPIQILMGKLLGVACLSMTLFAFWGGLGALTTSGMFQMPSAMAGAAPFLNAIADPKLLAVFAACFIGGYLMFGAIFLALGSLCESLQEAQTLLGPVIFILIVPILLVGPALENPNSPLVVGTSWIPLFTPFVLMMRAPSGLDWLSLIGPIALMIGGAVLVLVLAARVFRAGVVDQANAAALRERLMGKRSANKKTGAPV
jgi:ABC-2 type transport system permease protein